MIPVKTADCNFTFYMPGGTGEDRGQMDCYVTEGTVTSAWLLELDDPIDTCEGLYVRYTGSRPKTELGFGPCLEDADLRPYELTVDGGEAWTGMEMSDELRRYLKMGGRFVLRTHMRPPPPVAVYLA